MYIFANGGEELIYISSADWMVRNLHHRVETVFPIFDKTIKQYILDIINIQLKDNVKARLLNFKKVNTYKTNDQKPFRSQIETYNYIKNL